MAASETPASPFGSALITLARALERLHEILQHPAVQKAYGAASGPVTVGVTDVEAAGEPAAAVPSAIPPPVTRIEPRFDPEAVRELKRHRDASVGGPGLAVSAIQAGLVDEHRLFVVPVVVGGGTAVFPAGDRAGLDLVDQRRFASGVVYLRYRVRQERAGRGVGVSPGVGRTMEP